MPDSTLLDPRNARSDRLPLPGPAAGARRARNRFALRTFAIPMAIVALAALAFGCGGANDSPEHDDDRYSVVATTSMVADIVREVAGERATVTGLIGEGVDPHLYKPTRSDVATLLEADVVFYSGLLLEGKMTDTLIKVARSKPVHAVTEEIDASYLLEPPNLEGHPDPHVWMDVNAWARATDAVAAALAEHDPDDADGYRERAAAYGERLAQLDACAREAIASIPESKRILVTAHDAFNYFGRAYGIEVRGIQGISTESEAGLDDINRLVDLLVDRGITAIFVESSVARKNVEALQEGARARGHTVKIGGELFSDAMGETGTYRGTYIGMIDHNVTTITRALGGTTEAGGCFGLLESPVE